MLLHCPPLGGVLCKLFGIFCRRDWSPLPSLLFTPSFIAVGLVGVRFLLWVIIQYYLIWLLKLGALPLGSCASISGTARCSRLLLSVSCHCPRNICTWLGSHSSLFYLSSKILSVAFQRGREGERHQRFGPHGERGLQPGHVPCLTGNQTSDSGPCATTPWATPLRPEFAFTVPDCCFS